jgi:hypothetical protein
MRWSLRGATLAALLAKAAVAHAEPRFASFAEIAARDFARDTVSLSEVHSLDAERLAQLRAIVFGRHGRVFKNDGIQNWLKDQSWYVPDSSFSNASLNRIERENLDRIREGEAAYHEQIEPGDLRWWQGRVMTPDALGYHSRVEWDVLAAELEAVHGKRFVSEPWLQRYFDERYWYAPDRAYDPARLSAIERHNLATIDSLRRGPGGADVSPCDMALFEQRRIAPGQLRGASFSTLRILRNEIYARHGLTFGKEWLDEYFAERSWYVPRPGAVIVLSEVEQRNVATIVRAEREQRASLSTVSLDERMLDGLFREDVRLLRYQVYARHGRVFRERWIQDWVAQLEGYQPDAGYSDARLSPVERANLAILAAYEQFAAGEHDAPEG